MGAVGFVDDYIKIVRQRSLGLRSKAKFIGQTVIAVAFGWLTLQFPDSRGQSPGVACGVVHPGDRLEAADRRSSSSGCSS